MVNNVDESTTTIHKFRFASGQILSLDADQIERIPYLTAMVSSANHFSSIRDEDGHYKLDPHIEYKYFSFVLEPLSFHSVRQLFTCLPKSNDIIPIIALLDFLGIGPQPDPTLNDVNSTFFSNLVYSPLLETYLQIIRPPIIQDMAVRFAIAMAKEEYDFTKPKVVDQIYWFIMFILSAHKLFGSRLRHHVHKIAEHCFSLFKSRLLKPLNKLVLKIAKDVKKLNLTMDDDDDLNCDKESECPLEQIMDLIDEDHYYRYLFTRSPSLTERHNLLLHRTYTNSRYSSNRWFWDPYQIPNEETLFQPIYKRVSEIMYERLQSEICRRAVTEIHRCPSIFVSTARDEGTAFSLFSSTSLNFKKAFLFGLVDSSRFQRDHVLTDTDKRILRDIFESQHVQEEIRKHILEEIRVLTPKLERRYGELVKEVREYEQNHGISHEPDLWFDIYVYGQSIFEYIQEEALSYELALDKLHQCSILVTQMQERVLQTLYNVATERMIEWKNTEQEIVILRRNLSICPLSVKSFLTSKAIGHNYRIVPKKLLPKVQLKHSAR